MRTPAISQRYEVDDLNPGTHKLTSAERKLVDSAFAMLPKRHQKVLKDHLKSFSFVDRMPVSAITSPVDDNVDFKQYKITFHASLLKQTVSEWLSEKERSCFKKDSSSLHISVEAGTMNALVYVLIHEATHIVDGSTKILPQQWKKNANTIAVPAFAAGTWSNWLDLLPAYQDPLLQSVRYRMHGRLYTSSEALAVYSALKRTPLASLYSASNWHEDLAEYFTIYHFTHQLGQPYQIILKDGDQVIFSYKPMDSKLVRSRLGFMDAFYE